MRYQSTRSLNSDQIAVMDQLGATAGEPWDLFVSGQGRGLDRELDKITGNGVVIGLRGTLPLVSKTGLWVRMANRLGKHATNHVPFAYVLDHDRDRGRLADHPGPLIVKLPGKQRRRGIRLVRSGAEALEYSLGIAQEIEPSLQVAGRGMHLRCYVILAHDGRTLTPWLHQLGKCVYAPEGQIITAGAEPIPPGAPRTLADLSEGLRRAGHDPAPMLAALAANVKAALRCAAGSIAAPACATAAAMPFGVDFVVRPDLSVRLLEFNRRPDLKGRDDADRALKQRVWLDTLRLAGIAGGAPLADRL